MVRPVKIAELKNRLSYYLRRVQRGESILVCDRDRVIARIERVDPHAPGPESDLAVRRHMAAYLNVPVYKAFHEWLGRGPELGPMWQAWAAGDRKAAVAAIRRRRRSFSTRGTAGA